MFYRGQYEGGCGEYWQLGQLASTLQNSDDKQELINHCADEIKFASKTDRNKSTYFFSVDEL